jgi:organic radical activating enzyme
MSLPLIDWMAPPADAPRAPFLRLSTLWIQIAGTWCNLECVHCINASGPADPWLKPVSPEVVRRAIREAQGLGVKEIYFTGGEPFLHAEMLALLGDALEVAPTTVLTNGTLIDEATVDGLAALARRASSTRSRSGSASTTPTRRRTTACAEPAPFPRRSRPSSC